MDDVLDGIGDGVETGPHGPTRSISPTFPIIPTSSRQMRERNGRKIHSMRNNFFSLAIAISSSSSAISRVNGFSHRTCFPPRSAPFVFW